MAKKKLEANYFASVSVSINGEIFNASGDGAEVQRGLVASATFSKGKGRASLQKQVAACVMVNPERISLGIKEFVVDARAAVVPATKGRVVRYRPRLDTWEAAFEISYDENLLTETQLRRVADDLGSRVGLLDFRPEKKGSFGRFMVVKWEANNHEAVA